MRRDRSVLLLVFLLTPSVSAQQADRIAVRVLDPAGEKPLALAGVSCADPAGPGATVGADGRIPVLAACRKVRCWADGFLPGEAEVAGPSVDCRVTAAARIEGPVRGLASADGMEARLYGPGGNALAAREPLAPPTKNEELPRVSLGPVPAGRYRIDLVRVKDGWTCRADLGPLGHGLHAVSAAWRPPRRVQGKVVDAEGLPVESIAVRIWGKYPEDPPPAQRVPSGVDPIGAWTCGPSAPLEGETSADGTFSFPADAEGPVLLAAGGWDDPLGVAAGSFPKPPEETVVLRPARPVRLVARLVDEDDRPVGCRGALTVRDRESAWLSRLLPGATLNSPCSGDGSLRLGPFLSSEWDLYVRPKPGLPLRLRGDAPEAGTTEDLGVLRVERGAAVVVDVVDRSGAPVEGARVLGSGSAGLVFNVEGFTDSSGRAELAGFPETGRLRLEVSAEGYRTATRDDLDLSVGSVRIELDRGVILEGLVEGESGEPVPGAEVFALAGSGALASRTVATPEGTFRISDAEAGRLGLIASAQGYQTGEPLAVTVEAGETRSGIVLTLERAHGLRGTVLDPSGVPKAGATVRLVRDSGSVSLERAIAVGMTGADGKFTVAAEPGPRQSLVATAPGFGPAVEPDVLARGDSEIVLTLAPAGAVEARFPVDLPPTRWVSVRDGRGVGHSAAVAGRTSVLFSDLAAGKGAASLPPGAEKGVEIVAGRTTVVELRDGPAVEGTVSKDGRGLANYIVAVSELRDGGMASDGGVETDAAGRWRLENKKPGTYMFSAIGPEGRADKQVDLPQEGLVRVDLAVSTVLVDVLVRDRKSGGPVPNASLFLTPEGAKCMASMSRRSWGNLFEPDIDVSVSDGGCGFGSTDASGRARIFLSRPGPHAIQVGAKRYETHEGRVEIGEGSNAFSVELTPTPGPRVRVTLKSDPPGLPGTLECVAGGGQNRHSYGFVSGVQECPFEPGPAEVIFRVDGFGIGRTELVVPEDGDLEVTVTAVRCGQLLLARPQGSKGTPVVRDAAGLDWGGVLSRTSGGAIQRIETPELGAAWLLRYLPPGVYAVELDGNPRGTVVIEAGGTATIP
jgi:protocatechuate 3,4-dioxygenase beta subunit